MNPNNLKQAQILCAKLATVKSHYQQFESIKDSLLPEPQFNKQQEYSNSLVKEIKLLEKQIAEL